MEMVERVNAEFTRPAGWFDVSLDRRHRLSSGPDAVLRALTEPRSS
jgi:hypothetical protein